MATGRSRIVRAAALALAIGVNVLFLLLLASHRPGPGRDPIAPAMIWIAALEPVRASPRRSSPRRAANDAVPSAAAGSEPALVGATAALVPRPESAQDTAIPAPAIDWDAAAARAVEKTRRDAELQAARPSLDSQPQVLMLPENSKRLTGRIEHMEGGVIVTWLNEDCSVKVDPQAPPSWSLDPVGKFFGNHPPRCLVRSAAERRSEELADALEAGVKPRHLGGKRPLPPESGD
jgi:hypothetical protein